MKHLGDITKISGRTAPVVDCIIGGSPCQDLSIAGRRAGLAGKRSGLFMEQLRVIKEMREEDRERGRTGHLIRPRYMVWENVPGALSSNKGKDFQAVLTEIVRIAEPASPDVPMPCGGGGVVKIRLSLRCAGKMVSCLASTRRPVLGSPPKTAQNLACRRFWRPHRPRNTL